MAGRSSGMGGGVLGRVGGALGTSDAGLMKFGLVVAAAAVAVRAFIAASDRAANAAMERTKVELTVKDAVKNSIKAADATAISTFKANEGALKSMAGLGGDAMVADAQRFAMRNGPEGMQAYGKLAAGGKLNASTLSAIQAAADTGQISIDKAADVATSGKVRLSGSANDIAAAILSESTDKPTSAGDVSKMIATFDSSKFGQRVGTFERNEGQLASQGVARFQSSGSIFDAQHEAMSRLERPEMNARTDVAEKLYEQMAVLAAGSQAEWKIVGLLKDIGMVLGMSEGSRGTQLNQLGAAAAGAEN
jgi:hypothetical protein